MADGLHGLVMALHIRLILRKITWTEFAPISAHCSWMANRQFFFVLLRSVSCEVMLGAGRFAAPACSAPRSCENSLENHGNFAGKVLASLERLGKTPVEPLLGPGHEKPRNVFAQPQELENRGDKDFCQGMTNTAGQYLQKSRAASKCQNSRQYHAETTVVCPDTIGEFTIRLLGCLVTQAP